MNYTEALTYINDTLPMFQKQGSVAYRNNMNNAHALDSYFDYPHKAFKSIHIAGTNGKGSTCNMAAAMLQSAGYKVGLFTSPHLLDFRERIRVNGEKINESFVAEFITEHKTLFTKLDPSFFEISVFMAFCYFKQCDVDFAIIEVGLGGRIDTTNVINPILSVITGISIDHSNILGDTIEKIAIEKAGIIKPNTKVIIGSRKPESDPCFTEIASKNNAPIIFSEDIFRAELISADIQYQSFDIKNQRNNVVYKNIETDLGGKYQSKNIVTSLVIIEELKKIGIAIETQAIYNGLKNLKSITGFIGRWEIINDTPLTILDTSHNAEGITEALQQIATIPHSRLIFILGFVKDKNIDDILKLLPETACYFFTRPSVERGLDEKELSRRALTHGLFGNAYPTIEKAMTAAKRCDKKDVLIYIGGSIFLVADYLNQKQQIQTSVNQ